MNRKYFLNSSIEKENSEPCGIGRGLPPCGRGRGRGRGRDRGMGRNTKKCPFGGLGFGRGEGVGRGSARGNID